ncbi:uncharacterized protein LOC127131797 [Lathyrus oleraceus]|uniref:uncharacterized protein LOC127131797 n=1 Tax=Pisum sativum TaxID=3888 RepID=UPI0021CFD8ED|nr:uncharacterized protein LOC127131797 [Pisum sativum]
MVTTLKLSKDLNSISLAELISSLRSHKIELEEDEPQKKSKFVALKSISERRKPERNKAFQDEEEEDDDSENEDYDTEEELSLLSRRINQLWIKRQNNFRRPRQKGDRPDSTFRGRPNKEVTCYECKEPEHYRNECPKLKKDSSKKESFKNNSFKVKKKRLMETWDDSESEASKPDSEDEQANVAFIATTSGSLIEKIMNTTEQQVEASQQVATPADAPSITSYQESHVLDRPSHINLSTPFEKLEVLCELLVDFDNLKENGMELTQELKNQGWLTYFNRLYDPIYINLVKEFWRFADCENHYIMSHVL